MAIFLLVILYCILEISAGGSDAGICIFFLFILLIGAIGMVVIYITTTIMGTTTNFYDILHSKNQSSAVWIEDFFGYKPNMQKFKDYLLDNLSPNSARTYIAEPTAVINLYKGVEEIPCGERELKLMKVKSVKTTHCHLTVDELFKNCSGLRDIESQTISDKLYRTNSL